MWSALALLGTGMALVIAARDIIGWWLGFESEDERAGRSEMHMLMHMRDVDAMSPEAGPFARGRWLRSKERKAP